MEIAKFYISQGTSKSPYNVIAQRKLYLSQGQVLHKQLNLALTVLILNVNFFENSMKPVISSIENSGDSDQLAVSEASCSGSTLLAKQRTSLK